MYTETIISFFVVAGGYMFMSLTMQVSCVCRLRQCGDFARQFPQVLFYRWQPQKASSWKIQPNDTNSMYTSTVFATASSTHCPQV